MRVAISSGSQVNRLFGAIEVVVVVEVVVAVAVVIEVAKFSDVAHSRKDDHQNEE